MAFNPFQSGQQFAQLQEQRQQAIEAERRRQEGIAALSEEFGPGAQAPAAFAAVTGADRAERGFQAREEQRALDNVRQAEIDAERREQRDLLNQRVEEDRDIAAAERERIAQDRQRAEQIRAAQGVVNLFDQGISAGMSPDEIARRASPALQALGVSPEQIGELPQQIAQNPQLLNDLKTSLNAFAATGPRRAVGNPIPVRFSDGRSGLLQSFSDGSTQTIEGVVPLAVEQAGRRADIAERRAGIAEGTLEARLGENDRKVLKDVNAEIQTIDQARNFNETTIRAAGTVTRDIATIQQLATQAAGFGGNSFSEAITRAAAANIPGADTREVQRLIDSVKSNIGIDTLLRIKRSGAGLGQVPQSQLETLQSVLGNLDITRDPTLLLRDIGDINRQYLDIIDKSRESNQRLIQRENTLLRRRDTIERRAFNEPQREEGKPVPLNNLLDKYAPVGGQ